MSLSHRSTSRNPPQVALKDRIAALQQRKDASSTSSSASSSTSSLLKPQLTGPAGTGNGSIRNNLRDKIAKFEEKGGTPIPRGSFGIGAPPPDEGGKASKNRELYGNRISALGKGHHAFVPPHLTPHVTGNRAVTAPVAQTGVEEGAAAPGLGGRPQARKRYSSSAGLSLAGIPDGVVTSQSTGNMADIRGGLDMSMGEDDLAPLTPDYTGASAKSAPAWRSNSNRRSVMDLAERYDVMDYMAQIPPTPTRSRTISEGGFSSPGGPRSPLMSGDMDSFPLTQEPSQLQTLVEDASFAKEGTSPTKMESETREFDPSPVIVTPPEDDDLVQESVVKSSSQGSSLPTPPPDESSVSFPSSPTDVSPPSPGLPSPSRGSSSPSQSSSPSLSPSPEPANVGRSDSSSTLRLPQTAVSDAETTLSTSVSSDGDNQKSTTDDDHNTTEGTKSKEQDVPIQASISTIVPVSVPPIESQPVEQVASSPPTPSTASEMAISPSPSSNRLHSPTHSPVIEEDPEAQFITIQSSPHSQDLLPETPTTATAATFKFSATPATSTRRVQKEEVHDVPPLKQSSATTTTTTRTIIPPPRTSSIASSSTHSIDTYSSHSRETSQSSTGSGVSPTTPMAPKARSFSAVVHRKTTETNTAPINATTGNNKSGTAPSRTKSTSDNERAPGIRSKRNFKHLNNTNPSPPATQTTSSVVPNISVVEPPATPNASELQALLQETAILEQKLMQGELFDSEFDADGGLAAGLMYGSNGTSKSAVELSRFDDQESESRSGVPPRQRHPSTPALTLNHLGGGRNSEESSIPPTPPPKSARTTKRFQSLRNTLRSMPGSYPRNSMASTSEEISSEDSTVDTPPSPTFDLGPGIPPSSYNYSQTQSLTGSTSSHGHGGRPTTSSSKSVKSVKSSKSGNAGVASMGGSFKLSPKKGVQRAATFADRFLGRGGKGKRGQDSVPEPSFTDADVLHSTPVRRSASSNHTPTHSNTLSFINTSGTSASLSPNSPSRSISMMSLSASSMASSPDVTASFELDRDMVNEFPSVPQELPMRPSSTFLFPAQGASSAGVSRSSTMPARGGHHQKAATDSGYAEEQGKGRTSESSANVPWLTVSEHLDLL